MKKVFAFAISIALLNSGIAAERKTLEKRVTVTPSQRIEIEGISGSDVELRSWDKNEIYMKLNVEISSSDNDYEKEYISSVRISESVRESSVRLRFEETKSEESGWSFLRNIFKRFYISKNISGEVYIPKNNPLATDMKYGKISLDGMGGAVRLNGTSNALEISNCKSLEEIQNDYGTTTIRNSGGELLCDGKSSTIRIEDFDGSMQIDADYSEISIGRATGKIRISDKSGSIGIDETKSDVKINGDYSDITLSNVEGFADVKSASSSIKINNVGGVRVQANYSEVEITGVKGSTGKDIVISGQSGSLSLYDAAGNLLIDNPYSGIDLRRINGAVELTTKSADITAEDINGNWKSQTEYSSVNIERLSAETIYITNKSNPVSLRLKTVPSRIEIDNEYGDVNVGMPRGFSGSVELDAEYGSVNTNLNVKRKTAGSSGFAMGVIGTGNGSIKIRVKSGELELTEE